MNIGILTSYVVGGLMLLSILYFTNSTFSSTAETTTSSSTQSKLDNIVTILENDFARIGYNVSNPDLTPFFISLSDSSVEFRGDIYEDDSESADEVTWEFTNSDYTASTNPSDRILRRTWNKTPANPAAADVFQFSATHFELEFLDANGSSTSTSGDIVQVRVQLIVESSEPYVKASSTQPDRYYRSAWQRKIIINNAVYTN